MKELGYVLYAIYMVCTLWLLVAAGVQLHLLWHAKKGKRRPRKAVLKELPAVTVQVPVYNEKFVVEELLESLAALDYPAHSLELQVLDDSTDETSVLIDRKANELRQRGLRVDVVRRPNRNGYKAGALQHGLSLCRGEFIAIFDADFRPEPDFLKRLLPSFNNPQVGLVQARWGHANAGQNFLTRIQTLLLDMHFSVEQAGRFNAGYFVNFCGTAGIWRKQCIADAGGWDGSVLSEDLDLSYRAQAKGWKLVVNQEVQVPAQLPADVEAFKTQQFRWTKGMAQTARKMLGELWALPISFVKKLHGFFHLTGSVAFVCMFVNALLTLPMLQLRSQYPEFVTLTNYTAIGALNLLALTFLYYKSAAQSGKTGWQFLAHFPVFVVVYLALSVQNAVAVMQGFSGKASPFVRTPKSAGSSTTSPDYSETKWTAINTLEACLLLYFLCGISLSIHLGDYFLLSFFAMMVCGLGVTLWAPVAGLLRNLWQFFATRTVIAGQRQL